MTEFLCVCVCVCVQYFMRVAFRAAIGKRKIQLAALCKVNTWDEASSHKLVCLESLKAP